MWETSGIKKTNKRKRQNFMVFRTHLNVSFVSNIDILKNKKENFPSTKQDNVALCRCRNNIFFYNYSQKENFERERGDCVGKGAKSNFLRLKQKKNARF